MHHFRTFVVALTTVTLAVVAPAPCIVAQGGESPEALMGAAQHTQDVEGDLDAALAAYQKVLAHASASRSLKATALLRIGRLYEKRGVQDARRTYERIAREYADQPAVVAEARSRLAALDGGTTDQAQVVARQVWAGHDVDAFGSISQDGRFYAFADWSGANNGQLAVRDMNSGEVRRIPAASAAISGFAEYPTWSPDGRRIAYVWNNDLRIIAADGTAVRSLFHRDDAYPNSLRWSPDGRTLGVILTMYGKDRRDEMALIAVDSGQVIATRPAPGRTFTLGGFSPDGHTFLFGLGARGGEADGAIVALPVRGGAERVLLTGPGRLLYPTYTPDGRAVVFLSDRSGTMGLWKLDAGANPSASEPQLLKANTGEMTSLAFTRDGTLWYGVLTMTTDVYLCDFDSTTLQVRSAPKRLSERFIGASSGLAFSPDGRQVAFMRGVDRRKRTVIVRTLADGREQELTAPFADTVHASNWGPTWLPDGRSLLVSDANFGTNRFAIHQLGIESGQAAVAFDGDLLGTWPLVRISPDGRSYYFTRRLPEPSLDRGHLLLIRRDVATGAETELYRAPSLGAVGFFGLAVSPDGSHIAFSHNIAPTGRQLMVVPTSGGTARVLLRGTYAMPNPFTGSWTRDGQHVLVAGQPAGQPSTERTPVEVFAVPIDGGTPRSTGLKRVGGITAAQISPDGSRIVFGGGDRVSELWTFKNLVARTEAVTSTPRAASSTPRR